MENQLLSEVLANKLPALYFKLCSFLNTDAPKWKHLTKLNLSKFRNYLLNELSPGSAKTYCANLISVLNLYKDEVIIPCRDFAKVLSVKAQKSTNVFLTVEELERLKNYSPQTKTQSDILDRFLLQSWTGCRFSDMMQLTKENISEMDGKKYLSYTSEKTKITAVLRCSPMVANIIERLPEIKIYSHQTYNNVVRFICEYCEINIPVKLYQAGEIVTGEKWKFISSHTARRSFATNLYIKGIDILSISKMMGHTNTKQTEGYICAPITENKALDDFFS